MSKEVIFSTRQIEILQCLTQQMSNKDIAAALGLTKNTVGVHLWLLYKKLGVHSRGRALALAKEHGFLHESENLSISQRLIEAERSKLTHEMYFYIKSLESLSPEDRRKQACLVTKYEMIFEGAYNYPSL